MTLTFEDADLIIKQVHAKAAHLGLRVTAAVVDEGGHLIALGRMDGAPPVSPQIAEAKAVGAAMFHRDGGSIAQIAQDRPAFFSAVDKLVRVPLVPGPGSVPILDHDRIVGAVGVSGARPEQDLECAQAGIASLKRDGS